MFLRRSSFVLFLAAGATLSLAACGGASSTSTENGGANGQAGTPGGGGTTGTPTGGDTGTPTGGDTGTPTGGDTGTPTGGSTGTPTGGDTGTPTGGTTGTPTGGATGTPTGGTTGAGGSTNAGGSTGTGGSTPPPPPGRSAGCNKDIAANDAPGKYVKKSVMVTGVTFTKAPTAGGSWTNRIYYLNLPAKYDSTKAYPILFGGGGCGGDLSNGNGAFQTLPPTNTDVIQVGMSYVWPNGGGACFADGYADTPDLEYFDSMLRDLEASYCVDTGKVFVGGYSSGGWESYMLGYARGGTVVRGISPAAGGLRPTASRPPASNKPFAAIMVTGASDTANPADGATGSMAARDLILQINGCASTPPVAWPMYTGGNCMQYSCPAAYPVIYCRPPGGHIDGGAAYASARWALWQSLP